VKGTMAALNVFGPSTLVLISMVLTVGLLIVRSFVHQERFEVTRSSLIWLDAAIVGLFVAFMIFVYLRFLYLV
jgi:hypothetical protein